MLDIACICDVSHTQLSCCLHTALTVSEHMYVVHLWLLLLKCVEHIGQVTWMRPMLRLHVALACYTMEQKAPMFKRSTSHQLFPGSHAHL